MTERKIEMPTEQPGFHEQHEPDSKAYSHPAFGQISACRSTSTGYDLYGSETRHTNLMVVRINRSELHRGLSYDSHFPREELIEIGMTESQWQQFVSTPNHHAGPCCTIFSVGGKDMPLLPRRDPSAVFDTELRTRIKNLAATVDDAISDVEGEIGKSLSATKRDRILKHLRSLRSQITDAVPWVAKMFSEHMEERTARGKIEVHAYLQDTLRERGLEALGGSNPLQLRAGDGAAADTTTTKEP